MFDRNKSDEDGSSSSSDDDDEEKKKKKMKKKRHAENQPKIRLALRTQRTEERGTPVERESRERVFSERDDDETEEE
jgi:hypothetical protein